MMRCSYWNNGRHIFNTRFGPDPRGGYCMCGERVDAGPTPLENELFEALESTVLVLQEFANILRRDLPSTASLAEQPLAKARAVIRKVLSRNAGVKTS